MRNQPLNSELHDGDPQNGGLIDPPQAFRFRAMAVFFGVGVLVVLGRVAWVQARLQSGYLEVLTATTVEHELVPTRDGRILGSASEVLATDVEQYSVQMHYRWLQEPADDAWIGRQIRKRLSSEERKDHQFVEQTTAGLLEQRFRMWRSIAEICSVSPDLIQEKRAQIQRTVTRIADSVNRRHFPAQAESTPVSDDDHLLLRIAASVRESLTTTPRRRNRERIVVREEESWHDIVVDIPFEIAGQIRESPARFPGVRVVAQNRRTYPQNSLAAHIVGARTEQNEDDLARAAASKGTVDSTTSWGKQAVGRFGVERSFDHQLQGKPGRRKIVRNHRMEIIDSEIERKPVPGRDVVLTLNLRVQRHAEQLLAETLLDSPPILLADESTDEDRSQLPNQIPAGGSIVVMDVTTGRLIVAASAPSFNLSLFTSGTLDEWKEANADLRHPFLSRVTAMALPPGSVMKPFTAAAAMESNSLNPDESFYCQGYFQTPDRHRCLIFRLHGTGHNDLTLTRALGQSCNVYFFAAAQKTGFATLRTWADQFGFGRPTGVDLPFEKSGNVPGSSRNENTATNMENEALGLAIGQSSLTTTPLQIVRAMAAIANGGWLVTPHVVSQDGIARSEGDIDDTPRDLARHRISGLTSATVERIQEGLLAVVEQPWGTGHKTVHLDDVRIAGKTGTAESGGGRADHAWFAGYVPAHNPRYAITVVLQHGGSGSRSAGPLVREVIRSMLHENLLSLDGSKPR